MVSPLPVLITLEEAKLAARLDASLTTENPDLQLRLDIAHEAVLDYVNNRVDTETADAWLETILAWDSTTAPRQILAAILAMFTYLVRFRGDDADTARQALPDGDLPDHVRMYLKRLRDPTVA